MRSKSVLYTLFGHNDTVTSLSLSPSGTHILSASADDTIRVWDVRPFAPSSSSSGDPSADPRLYKTFPGAAAGFEGWLRKASWDRDGSRIAVGGADRTVTIYNVEQSRLTHKLPGKLYGYSSDFLEPIQFSSLTSPPCCRTHWLRDSSRFLTERQHHRIRWSRPSDLPRRNTREVAKTSSDSFETKMEGRNQAYLYISVATISAVCVEIDTKAKGKEVFLNRGPGLSDLLSATQMVTHSRSAHA